MSPRAPSLTPADGPADPPSSRPNAGVLGGQVFAYRFDPALGVQRVAVPGLEAVRIDEDTVVRWAFYADGPEAVHAPHAALAVTVDVRFDDGSRLSGEPRLRDRYGMPPTSETQFAAAWSMPEQWNADAVPLEAWAGRRGTVEVALGSPALEGAGTGEVSGFVEVVVASREAGLDPSPSERVDTRRGSHSGARFSRGNTIPITARPHGFCFLTPATDAADARWPYRWSVHDDPQGRRLEAVQFSHQPSPWIGDRGVLQLMPFVGSAASSRFRRRRWIVSGSEVARPHSYSAALDGGLRLEMTATDHGGAFRATAADASAAVGFMVDQLTDAGRLHLSPDGSFHGWIPEGAADWGNPPRTYFAGRVLSAVTATGMLDDDDRPHAAGFIAGTGSLEVRVAQSFLSVEQARRALEQELGAERSFEDLRSDLRDQWDRLLGAVTVPEPDPQERPFRSLADEEDRSRIASALYRLHLYPDSASENIGTASDPQWRFTDPMADNASAGAGRFFVNNGYWDTYRTAWPAFALLDPATTGVMLDGLLQQWRRGGYMARWSAPGYVDSMVGTSSDQIFADAARWGVPFAREDAFESAWRNACEPSDDPRRGRKGIARARFTGYVAREVPEGMSWSLENAISDDAIARFASLLADADAGADAARYRAFARYFGNRARSYRMLFDADHGFFRGRGDDGSFPDEPFDPRVWGGDNVETNGWGMSLSAVHDGPGLAELYGGPAALRAHLDRLFAEPETADEAFCGAYGTVIHEQREARAQRSGMCAISNQPAHHIPWMHVFGDEPWRAGETVHGLARRLFAGAVIGQGFPGDEDNGEMSMWWLWAALGLYPLVLASGELRIGSPLFDDVSVRRTGGGRLRIRSHRRSPEARYLVEARLDGAALDRPVLEVGALEGDAELELLFTDDAAEAAKSPLWQGSAAIEPWRPDLTGSTGRAVGSISDAAVLFDDGASGSRAVLAPGDWVGWRFDEARRVSDVSVTADGAAALMWEASDDGIEWRTVPTTHVEDLRADRTTPFTFVEAVTARMLRVRAIEAAGLRQVELFDLD